MNRAFPFRIIVPFLIMGAFLVGCTASKPTSFYLLTEEIPKNGTAIRDRDTACPGVVLGQISFPEYLEGTNIMTRVGPNRLRLNELHHWAEPLRENFVRVLVGNLDSRLCGENVNAVSRDARSEKAYRLRVNVFRFEPLKRERALLRARWSVLNRKNGETVCTRLSSYAHPIAGAEHQDVAAAMSRAVASLSGDIAECLLRVAAEARGR